jgi:bifunctional non-homologous end joining protein LigD
MRERSSSRFLARVLPGAKPAPFPDFIEPCLASLRTSVPSASGFVHELKLDGYRVQAHLHDGRVRLYTRSGLDWTNRFPSIAVDIGRLPASKLIIDGEVISADAQGRPSFSTLQDDLKQRRYDRMVYYAFDLLHLDGFDTRTAPLIERKRVLQSFLLEAAATSPLILYSEHFEDGPDLYARTRAMGLEGIVSKRANAPYRSGRGDSGSRSSAGNASAS